MKDNELLMVISIKNGKRSTIYNLEKELLKAKEEYTMCMDLLSENCPHVWSSVAECCLVCGVPPRRSQS